MSAALGSLVVSIEANMAKFQTEMSKSAYMTEQAMNRMAASADLARSAITNFVGGLVAGVTAGAAFNAVITAVNNTVDSLAKLDDMTQKTGASVENLSKLSKVATTFGQNFDEVDVAMSKLAKGMNGVDEEGSKVKAGLDALGISTKNLKDQDPSEVFIKVARRLQDYKDGVGKTALVTDVLGKSAAGLIPYMNDVAEHVEKFRSVSASATTAASQYQDQLGLLKIKHTELVESLVIQALPAMTDFTKAMLEAKKQSDALTASGAITDWADKAATAAAYVIDSFRGVVSVFEIVGTSLGGLLAAASLALEGNFSGAKSVFSEIKREIEEIQKKPSLVKALENQRANRIAPGTKPDEPEKPPLNYASPKAAGSVADDPARKLRDTALKRIENGLAAERDAMRFHDDYITELRNQDLIDFKTYEDERQASRNADLAAAVSAYDKEIAILQDYKAKTNKLKEKADADLKIEEVRGKKEKAIADAAQANVMATLKQGAAQSDLRKAMEDWSRQQEANLGQMQMEIDMMGLSQVEIAKLTAARRILAEVEEQIRRAKEKGPVSDDDVDVYRRQAAEAVARSNAVYDAGETKRKDPYFNMRESLRQYGEEANNVGQQVGQAMQNAFRGAEDALVTFAMTGKISFGGLAKSIMADLARIEAKNLIAALTGSGNGGGGLVGGMGTALGKLLGFADGGDPPVGQASWVGERGPEIFVPKSSGTIIPNHMLQGGGQSSPNITVQNTYHIDSRTDQSTIVQMLERTKAQTKAEIQREMRSSRTAYSRA